MAGFWTTTKFWYIAISDLTQKRVLKCLPKSSTLIAHLCFFSFFGASDSDRVLDRGIRSSSLELAFGGFSALGELLRPRTSHKRQKSDLCHFLFLCFALVCFASGSFRDLGPGIWSSS